MDEEIWSGTERPVPHSRFVQLSETDPGIYELMIEDGVTISSITLDQKHLKDLFNALGNELGAF